jgi:hypothetical protein
MTSVSTLPTYFVLYILTRHNSTDPYGGFILVRTNTGSTGGYRLTPEPATNSPHRLTRLSAAKKPAKKFKVSFELADNTSVLKEVWDWSSILQIKMSSGLQIPILTIVGHSSIVRHGEKRNILIQQQEVVSQPTPSSLPLFVAHQLLELAQLKRESCPITIEEFTTGHTGVMPCGHLFTRLAITESFKTAASRCPTCRIAGTPIFV